MVGGCCGVHLGVYPGCEVVGCGDECIDVLTSLSECCLGGGEIIILDLSYT